MPERTPYRPTKDEEEKAEGMLTVDEVFSSVDRERYVKIKRDVEVLTAKIAEKRDGVQSARHLFNFLVEQDKGRIRWANDMMERTKPFERRAQEYNLSNAKERALYCLAFGNGRKFEAEPRVPMTILAIVKGSDVPEPERYAMLSLAYRKDSEDTKQTAHDPLTYSGFKDDEIKEVEEAYLDYSKRAEVKSRVFSGELPWKDTPEDRATAWGKHESGVFLPHYDEPEPEYEDYQTEHSSEDEEGYEEHEEKIPGHNDIYDGRTRDIDPNIR